MKKDSLGDVTDTRDNLLTLSTQSQEDDQVLLQKNSGVIEGLCNNSDKPCSDSLQKECSEEGFDYAYKKLNSKHASTCDTTSKKGKFSYVLNEITRAAGSSGVNVIAASAIQPHNCYPQKKWSFCQPDDKRSSSDVNSSLNQFRKSSIVSIYCKKNDITFVSSPEEFAMKVMNSNNNVDEDNPHLSQLQIELIISNKDKDYEEEVNSCKPNTEKQQQSQLYTLSQHIPPCKSNSLSEIPSLYRKFSSSTNEILKNQNAISEREIVFEENEVQIIEDDEYDLLISSPSRNSLQKAIEEHRLLLKQHQRECEKQERGSTPSKQMSAFELLFQLKSQIENF